MMEFRREGENFAIIFSHNGEKYEVILDRVMARATARFFMVELNVVEAFVQLTPEKQVPLSSIDNKFTEMLRNRRGF
jgi:hypothetical protein